MRAAPEKDGVLCLFGDCMKHGLATEHTQQSLLRLAGRILLQPQGTSPGVEGEQKNQGRHSKSYLWGAIGIFVAMTLLMCIYQQIRRRQVRRRNIRNGQSVTTKWVTTSQRAVQSSQNAGPDTVADRMLRNVHSVRIEILPVPSMQHTSSGPQKYSSYTRSEVDQYDSDVQLEAKLLKSSPESSLPAPSAPPAPIQEDIKVSYHQSHASIQLYGGRTELQEPAHGATETTVVNPLHGHTSGLQSARQISLHKIVLNSVLRRWATESTLLTESKSLRFSQCASNPHPTTNPPLTPCGVTQPQGASLWLQPGVSTPSTDQQTQQPAKTGSFRRLLQFVAAPAPGITRQPFPPSLRKSPPEPAEQAPPQNGGVPPPPYAPPPPAGVYPRVVYEHDGHRDGTFPTIVHAKTDAPSSIEHAEPPGNALGIQLSTQPPPPISPLVTRRAYDSRSGQEGTLQNPACASAKQHYSTDLAHSAVVLRVSVDISQPLHPASERNQQLSTSIEKPLPDQSPSTGPVSSFVPGPTTPPLVLPLTKGPTSTPSPPHPIIRPSDSLRTSGRSSSTLSWRNTQYDSGTESSTVRPRERILCVAGREAQDLLREGYEIQQRPYLKQAVTNAMVQVSPGDGCPICKEEWAESEGAVRLSCGHVFHHQCVLGWAYGQVHGEEKCPLCEQVLFAKRVVS